MGAQYQECPRCKKRRVRVDNRYHDNGFFRCDYCGLSGWSMDELEAQAEALRTGPSGSTLTAQNA